MSKISVTYINGLGYIFNADDYMRIRQTHRIIGNLIGINGVNVRNSNLKGLPAIFNQLELSLLLETNAIILHEKPTLNDPPSAELQSQFNEFQAKNLVEQREVQRQIKVEERRLHLNKIMEAKRNRLLKINPEADIQLDPDEVLEEEVSQTFSFNRDTVVVQVPTQHYIQLDTKEITLPPNNTFKYRVFRDIWNRGKYITSGEAFGGDFIIYPGDPVYFHASHIVHVMNDKSISASLIAARGRLSVTVNKFCIFAYENEKRDICYQTIEWEGNLETR